MWTKYSCSKKVVWPVDLLEENSATTNKIIWSLKALAVRQDILIQPIYVMTHDQFHLSFSQFDRSMRELEKSLKDQFDDDSLFEHPPRVMRGRILTQEGPFIVESARLVDEFATDGQADFIAVGTHARRGAKRFFMGSFTETLLTHGRTPVLAVNPNSRSIPPHFKILVPMDKGLRSEAAYEAALSWAAQNNAELTLYHSLGGGRGLRSRSNIAEDSVLEKRWSLDAKVRGVQIHRFFDDRPGDVALSILELATRFAFDLIIMAAQKGPFAAVVLGSITRQVVRNAPCPVLAVRAPAKISLGQMIASAYMTETTLGGEI